MCRKTAKNAGASLLSNSAAAAAAALSVERRERETLGRSTYDGDYPTLNWLGN